MSTESSSQANFQHLTITMEGTVAQVRLNRPDKSNALNETLWYEIGQAFEWLDQETDARVAVLAGAGKNFCSGLDFSFLMKITSTFAGIKCEGRKREWLRRHVMSMQASLTAIENCRLPVLAAVHGACVGGAIDLVTACDMRYASENAYFNVKEVDLGLAADVGTLQRLPSIVGQGVAREWAYLACDVDANEAHRTGLVNQFFADEESLLAEVTAIAEKIAAKSPLAVRSSKAILNHARDHSVAEGLDYVATWNAAVLVSNDSAECMTAKMQKRVPEFLPLEN